MSVLLLVLFGTELIPINGTELRVQTIGKGEPVILVHGGPGLSHDYFMPHFEVLAKTHQVIMYDQRVSGGSSIEVETEHISMDAFVEDIAGLMKHYGHEKVHLMGHSYGGLITMFFAKKYPDKVKTLSLICSVAGDDHYGQTYSQSLASKVTPESQQEVQSIQATEGFKKREPETMEAFFRAAFKPTLFDPSSAEKLSFYFEPNFGIRSAKLRALAQLGHYHLKEDMGKFNQPVLLIYGAADPMPEDGRTMMKDYFPKSELVTLDASGHFPFAEQPDAFFEAVTTFLSK